MKNIKAHLKATKFGNEDVVLECESLEYKIKDKNLRLRHQNDFLRPKAQKFIKKKLLSWGYISSMKIFFTWKDQK